MANSGYKPNNKNSKNNSGTSKKKHSGCTAGEGKNGSMYFRGWNYSQREGMITVFCYPYDGKNSKTHQVTSNNGNTFENWLAKVQVGKKEPYITSCMVNINNGTCTIQPLGWVLNPKAPNGGYCGKFTQ